MPSLITKLFKSDGEEETEKSRMEKARYWVTDISYNSNELLTDMAVVTRFPMGFEFSKSRALRCWKITGLSRCKNKHKPLIAK